MNALLRSTSRPTPARRTLRQRALDDLFELSAGGRFAPRRPPRGRETISTTRGRPGSVRTFVDTNVLVYLFDAGGAGKQQRAREVVATLARDGSARAELSGAQRVLRDGHAQARAAAAGAQRAPGAPRPVRVPLRADRLRARAPRRCPLGRGTAGPLGRPHRRGGRRSRRRRPVLGGLPVRTRVPGRARGGPFAPVDRPRTPASRTTKGREPDRLPAPFAHPSRPLPRGLTSCACRPRRPP